jgi:dipeptidyl aminopeptidase/acylaminoacyl peptidase
VTRTRLALATGAAFVLLIAIVGSLITDESQPQAFPEPAGNGDGNGLIAYSYTGDIYVGDPATGETTAVVTHAEYEVNPVFSPDGKRIAFIRGDPQAGGLDDRGGSSGRFRRARHSSEGT